LFCFYLPTLSYLLLKTGSHYCNTYLAHGCDGVVFELHCIGNTITPLSAAALAREIELIWKCIPTWYGMLLPLWYGILLWRGTVIWCSTAIKCGMSLHVLVRSAWYETALKCEST
jgi:hypothetical protein